MRLSPYLIFFLLRHVSRGQQRVRVRHVSDRQIVRAYKRHTRSTFKRTGFWQTINQRTRARLERSAAYQADVAALRAKWNAR